MAVSTHKTNNIINCSGCHLPFNFNNSVPKSLPCKHWFCLACLEDMIGKSDDFAHFECVNCHQTIDIEGLNKTLEILPTNEENIESEICTSNTANNLLLRSSSISSDNSLGCTLFYNGNGSSSQSNNGHLNLMSGNGGGVCNSNRSGENSLNISHYEQMCPGENCIVHGMPNTLWCSSCDVAICRGCNSGPEHVDHLVQSQQEAKDLYQNRIHQDIAKLQNSLGDIEQLQRIQREFLLQILEGCCALKSHLENELAQQSQSMQIDNMRETLKMLTIHMEMMPENNPQDFLKLSSVVNEEKQKFHVKHRDMMRQFQLSEMISTHERIFDFSTMQQLLQKFDQRAGDITSPNMGNFKNYHHHNHHQSIPNNPMLHLTNYCIFHLYVRYTKQKQQFFENQLWRYQQYQEQIIANFKNHQKSVVVTTTTTPPTTTSMQTMTATSSSSTAYHAANMNTHTNLNGNTNHNSSSSGSSSSIIAGYEQLQFNKRKTYAEIANNSTSTSKSYDSNNDAFDLFNGPLTNSQYKQLEDVGKCIDLLLLNPISNDNNHIYYFDFERNGEFLGRVLIKVYASYAPKMSYNFHALCTHEKGVGYRGCKVFKCYPNQSIITGDIEQNNGYGSRSIYEEPQFVPDDTKIPPFIGAVGMRRAKKIYDSQCLVGSQFRIILKVRPFSAIFGRVIEGLEVVWNISQTQIQNEKNNSAGGNSGAGGGGGGGNTSINVAQCGVYEFVKRNLSGGL
ncbi:uncharacterized protein LOC142219843 [Haematobia irritans]|uniref:uncharacterized protein LOC142219843 n=1 Tax=Haematobia irritans TaxID=7368 RepID=UPI003F5004A3